MNNIKFKRLSSYLVDLIIVIFLTTLLSQINFLNPYKDKYQKTYDKYEEFYNENFNENTTINNDILTSKTYLDLTHKLAYYSISYTIILVLVCMLYYGVFPYIFDGQTIGKKLFKLKIVSIDNKKLSLSKHLIRALFYPIWTSIILYTPLSNLLLILCVLLLKGKTYFYMNLGISILFAIYSYIDVILLINKDRCLHDKLSYAKIIELNKGEVNE